MIEHLGCGPFRGFADNGQQESNSRDYYYINIFSTYYTHKVNYVVIHVCGLPHITYRSTKFRIGARCMIQGRNRTKRSVGVLLTEFKTSQVCEDSSPYLDDSLGRTTALVF